MDLDQWPFIGIEKNDCPLVVHAPTNDVYKGSKFVLKALQELKDEGLRFEYKIIRNLPHEQAQEIYRKADIIVDQLLIGTTGVLTLEAWALGKPCAVYLQEDLFKPYYGNDLGVANVNPDNIKDKLRELIKDQDYRFHLSKRGRELVEKHHEMSKVANQFIDMYERVLDGSLKNPAPDKYDASFLLIASKQIRKQIQKQARNSKAGLLKRIVRRLQREWQRIFVKTKAKPQPKPIKKKAKPQPKPNMVRKKPIIKRRRRIRKSQPYVSGVVLYSNQDNSVVKLLLRDSLRFVNLVFRRPAEMPALLKKGIRTRAYFIKERLRSPAKQGKADE